VIATTGNTWNEIIQTWTIPRVLKWYQTTRGFPPLAVMVGSYIGYKPNDPDNVLGKRETDEEAAKRILGGLGAI
jgi:hypothetical protein